MSSPTSIRFEEPVSRRLTSYALRHPGVTRSAVAARFVDEGLRMDEHPGIAFRDGAAGRRAFVMGGPDVWEVVRAVRSARHAEPRLGERALLEMVEENTGVPQSMISTALAYWGAHPDEVEALIQHAERAEADHENAADRSASLLGR